MPDCKGGFHSGYTITTGKIEKSGELDYLASFSNNVSVQKRMRQWKDA